MLVGMSLDGAKTLSESLRVTVLAAGTDIDTAADRVPGRVGPFDGGVQGQIRNVLAA